ncbi:MAG: hypothetical protein ACI9NT_002249 [Bacteroidia bacterium]|jgi:hypothetical protein
MKKFQFLCTNHRRWLSGNREAAIHTWLQSYSRCLDLVDERNYLLAINHAGAAFEASEIALNQENPATSVTIQRFADSGVLLAQLLYWTKESRFASAVLASSIARFEKLLVLGVERKTVLAGCERLLEVGESLTCFDCSFGGNANATAASQQVH